MTITTAVELRVAFDSAQSWRRWRAENAMDYATWRDDVLDAVKTHGLVEPISGRDVPADTIEIKPDALTESLSSGSLNCRKRALLVQAIESLEAGVTRGTVKPLVLATEPAVRTGQLLRHRYLVQGPGADEPVESIARFQDESFDLAVVGERRWLLPDIEGALAGFLRALRPGGTLVATVPFNPDRGSAGDGKAMQGWEILDLARQVGFRDATMTLHISARHGIVSNHDMPGVFVLSATRPEQEGVAADAPARSDPAEQVANLVCVLGLPRSGTTMLTGALAVAPSVVPVFEPFNADAQKRWAKGPMSVTRFISAYDVDVTPGCTLLVKETCKTMEFVDCIDQLLDSVHPPATRHCILILRDPFNCLLSEIQGRRDWWGEPDLELTGELFDRWSDRTLRGYRRMLATVERTRGFCVSYAGLVADPMLMRDVTEAVGLPFVDAQLSFHKHLDLGLVRGDISLTKTPRPIGGESDAKRRAELEGVLDRIQDASLYPAVAALQQVLGELPANRLLRAGSEGFRRLRRALG